MQRKLLFILLVCLVISETQGDDEDLLKPTKQTLTDQPTVELDKKIQILSGLTTKILSLSQQQSEYEVVGKVVSIEPLLALREKYLVAQTELAVAEAKAKQAQQSLNRQQDLFHDGIAAKRSVQEQGALLSIDNAQVAAGKVRLSALENSVRINWGRELAEWALSSQRNQLLAFLSGHRKLLQITLPSNKNFPDKLSTITVEANGRRDIAYPAMMVSRVTRTDTAMQGESYFFYVDTDKLYVGMKVSAWLPEPTVEQAGVVIPESALLWYMGQIYVYVKTREEVFSRRLITFFSAIPGGYLIPQDIKKGEEIVVTGGQMLLSEELRGHIPDED